MYTFGRYGRALVGTWAIWEEHRRGRAALQEDGASLSDVSESSNQSNGSVVRLNWPKASTTALSCSLLQVRHLALLLSLARGVIFYCQC